MILLQVLSGATAPVFLPFALLADFSTKDRGHFLKRNALSPSHPVPRKCPGPAPRSPAPGKGTGATRPVLTAVWRALQGLSRTQEAASKWPRPWDHRGVVDKVGAVLSQSEVFYARFVPRTE